MRLVSFRNLSVSIVNKKSSRHISPLLSICFVAIIKFYFWSCFAMIARSLP